MGKKFKDSDILSAMIREIDKDSVVYGANGHYSVGGYFNLYGNTYNVEENTKSAEEAPAAQSFMEETEEEGLAKGLI